VVAVLSALDRPAIPGVRWTTPEQWLVKVRPLGHVDDRVVPPLLEVLEAELDGAPPVGCVLGPATRRLGGQWLGAPVAGLEELAAVVFEATEELIPVTHRGWPCRRAAIDIRPHHRIRPTCEHHPFLGEVAAVRHGRQMNPSSCVPLGASAPPEGDATAPRSGL
jgi:hypothetical protein